MIVPGGWEGLKKWKKADIYEMHYFWPDKPTPLCGKDVWQIRIPVLAPLPSLMCEKCSARLKKIKQVNATQDGAMTAVAGGSND